MKKKSQIFVLVLILLISTTTKAQKFSSIQQKKLEEQAELFVQSYSELLGFISDKNINATAKIEAAHNWHNKKDVLLFNNISPDNSNVFIRVEDYVEILAKDYPAGAVISANLIKTEPIKPGLSVKAGTRLHVAIPVQISITGIYRGEKIIKSKKNLYLLYGFNKAGSTGLSDFKFKKLVVENNLFPLLDYQYFMSEVVFGGNLSSLNSNSDWLYNASSTSPSFQFGASVHKSFNKYFGVNAGFLFKQYTYHFDWNANSGYVLISNQGNTILLPNPPDENSTNALVIKDRDDDDAIPFFSSQGIVDERKINVIDLPISAEFKYDHPGKYAIYFQLGMLLSYKTSTKVSAQGAFTSQGYYPDYDFVLHDLEDYGYVTKEINNNYKIKNKSFTFSPFVSTGARFHIHPKIGVGLQLFATLPDQDFFFEYESNSSIHSFAPEYSIKRLVTEQFNGESASGDKPWVEKADLLALNFGFNVGVFYKF